MFAKIKQQIDRLRERERLRMIVSACIDIGVFAVIVLKDVIWFTCVFLLLVPLYFLWTDFDAARHAILYVPEEQFVSEEQFRNEVYLGLKLAVVFIIIYRAIVGCVNGSILYTRRILDTAKGSIRAESDDNKTYH